MTLRRLLRAVVQFHRRLRNWCWHSLVPSWAPLTISCNTLGSLRQISTWRLFILSCRPLSLKFVLSRCCRTRRWRHRRIGSIIMAWLALALMAQKTKKIKTIQMKCCWTIAIPTRGIPSAKVRKTKERNTEARFLERLFLIRLLTENKRRIGSQSLFPIPSNSSLWRRRISRNSWISVREERGDIQEHRWRNSYLVTNPLLFILEKNKQAASGFR